MAKLSRREFLKHTGLAGAALGITPPLADPGLSHPAETLLPLGRAFALTDVYQHPDLSGPVAGELAPDSVHSILEAVPEGWYRLNKGYVPRHALQPIAAYARPAVVENPGSGFWAEIVAPVSALRGWCAGHAPIVARLGYGAVVYVSDILATDNGEVWYGLAASPDAPLYGWVSALHCAQWSPTVESKYSIGSPAIKIDTRHFQLTVYHGNRELYRSRIYGPALPSTNTTLTVVRPGASLDGFFPLGVPWFMSLGTGVPVYGAFWHNRFGSQRDDVSTMNTAVELPTFAARWLYNFLLDNSHISSSVEVC